MMCFSNFKPRVTNVEYLDESSHEPWKLRETSKVLVWLNAAITIIKLIMWKKTQKIDILAHVSQHSVTKGLRIQLRSENPRPKKHIHSILDRQPSVLSFVTDWIHNRNPNINSDNKRNLKMYVTS